MSKTSRYEAPIPQPVRQRDRKRCYTVWRKIGFSKSFRAGGKVVWLTDKELTFARIKYPNTYFDEVLERDRLEEYKKYLDATMK